MLGARHPHWRRLSGHGTQAQLEAKLAAHDDRIERKIADMVQTLDVAKRAGLTA